MAAGIFNNDQASLPLRQVVPLTGIYPQRPNGVDDFTDSQYLGFVRNFAGFPTPSDGLALGQTLSIAQQTALFSLLGTTYGGNGRTTFNEPNLGGTVEVGSGPNLPLGTQQGSDTITVTAGQLPPNLGGTSQPIDNMQPSLAINYVIRVNGDFPTAGPALDGYTGEVLAALTNFAPDGFVVANGQLLSVTANPELFAVIGNTYGGDGVTNFAVPNLVGRNIIGAGALPLGAVVGQNTVTLTQANEPAAQGGAGATFNNEAAGLALNYIIDVSNGLFPSQGSAIQDGNYLGEVRAFAGAALEISSGWMLAAGQILPINQNQALFALLGTTYGGNGINTFGLPDLRGRVVVGTDNANPLGAAYGSNTATLTVTDATPCFCRGTAILTERGEVAVEALAIGDRVVTLSGAVRAIRWIGRRSYAGRFLAANRDAHPVLFRAGSLGEGLPRRDLMVSALHALFLNGVLVPAGELVNGATITTVVPEQVDYFHVELDSHDILIAEGAACESYLDDHSRGAFHNAADYARRYGDAPADPRWYAPLVTSGYALEAIRQRLVGLRAA